MHGNYRIAMGVDFGFEQYSEKKLRITPGDSGDFTGKGKGLTSITDFSQYLETLQVK
jgi:hypothetical protein